MHDALPHRRCPACQSEMDPLQVRGVTIDGCTNCNGFWFDTDELVALADRDIVESVVGHAMRSGYRCHCKKCHDELNDSPHVTECFKCGQAVPKCPRCGDVTLSIGNFQGVNLDVCPCCHGIFFDAGELQLLLRGQGSATYVAQDALNRLYQGGVRAVWNFAPTDLTHPEDMIAVNVHLSDSLQILSYKIAHRDND